MIIKSIPEFGANLKDFLDTAAKESATDVPFDVATITIAENLHGHRYVLFALNQYYEEDVLRVFNNLSDFWDYLRTVIEVNDLSFTDVSVASQD
jgi:hypothetical protein